MERARRVLARYREKLLRCPGVTGVGLGLREHKGRRYPAVLIFVAGRPSGGRPPPASVGGVPTEILEVGRVTMLPADENGEQRPPWLTGARGVFRHVAARVEGTRRFPGIY
jgi:hypothetical protein